MKNTNAIQQACEGLREAARVERYKDAFRFACLLEDLETTPEIHNLAAYMRRVAGDLESRRCPAEHRAEAKELIFSYAERVNSVAQRYINDKQCVEDMHDQLSTFYDRYWNKQ